MKIKMTGRKWATSAHQRAMRKLVRHAMSHYPKDHALHSAVTGALDAMDAATGKLAKAKAGKRMKRKVARRRAPARSRTARRRMTLRRRGSLRGRAPMRRTVRRMRRRAS
jgi:hypothetical protein